MDRLTRKRIVPASVGLISFALVLLIAPGCSSPDPGNTLQALAGDLARQLLTWWLL